MRRRDLLQSSLALALPGWMSCTKKRAAKTPTKPTYHKPRFVIIVPQDPIEREQRGRWWTEFGLVAQLVLLYPFTEYSVPSYAFFPFFEFVCAGAKSLQVEENTVMAIVDPMHPERRPMILDDWINSPGLLVSCISICTKFIDDPSKREERIKETTAMLSHEEQESLSRALTSGESVSDELLVKGFPLLYYSYKPHRTALIERATRLSARNLLAQAPKGSTWRGAPPSKDEIEQYLSELTKTHNPITPTIPLGTLFLELHAKT